MRSDAFTKREKANEDYFVKQKEREKLMALRDKIKAQQQHLKELDEHLYVSKANLMPCFCGLLIPMLRETLSKSSGGEQN